VSIDLGEALLRLARDAIGRQFGMAVPAAPVLKALDEPGATFVTLTQGGQLRGCIGTLEAYRPLLRDVRENAVAAAFRDPRFTPLRADELPRTRVEVSLLAAAEPIYFRDERDALEQLVPGVDGVILMHDSHRATFLPQVWESLPEPEQFMAQLKRKAGLPPDFWNEQLTLARYRVAKWKEPEVTWV
jgi:AmmeMemoRadiSam system protein A